MTIKSDVLDITKEVMTLLESTDLEPDEKLGILAALTVETACSGGLPLEKLLKGMSALYNSLEEEMSKSDDNDNINDKELN